VTDLPTALRAAVADPPPTSIDVDRLIATERRRRSRLVVTSAGALTLVAALATAAVVAGPGDRPLIGAAPAPRDPCALPSVPSYLPSGVADPIRRPAESHAAAAERLTAALPPLLPDGAHPRQGSGCDRIEFRWDPDQAAYQANAWVGVDDQTSIVVLVRPRDRSQKTPRCMILNGRECGRWDFWPGVVTMTDLGPADTQDRSRLTVAVHRPDDTWVGVVVIGFHDDLWTLPNWAKLGNAPGLTLYP
jgi:hypothetical protein